MSKQFIHVYIYVARSDHTNMDLKYMRWLIMQTYCLGQKKSNLERMKNVLSSKDT